MVEKMATGLSLRDFMYQYSFMDALLAGVYDGNLFLRELKNWGDFGIGTLNGLEGELIIYEGKVFKTQENGAIKDFAENDLTPFAIVKYFNRSDSFFVSIDSMDYHTLKTEIDKRVIKNKMYAVCLRGTFSMIHARSVTLARRPYLEMAAHISNGGQKEYWYTNIEAICVGFLLPQHIGSINVPGYHLHFISEDLQVGGHVFDFRADKLEVSLDSVKGYIIELNTHPDFYRTDFSKDRKSDMTEVEARSKKIRNE
ncbi:acetolactate decarboxylase [Chitinophaga vietnamensis]|uniref:acetolactate decarboxylase n=1 Tax=Chitinophaga vietnamensis TaxID=2593957 RepID=UPI0011778852|nr:acetolactate decarboxylase [Chitinophaga vietnamensis]